MPRSNAVACYIGSVYLCPRDARRIAKALHVASRDVDKLAFQDSRCGTFQRDCPDGRDVEPGDA